MQRHTDKSNAKIHKKSNNRKNENIFFSMFNAFQPIFKKCNERTPTTPKHATAPEEQLHIGW